MEDGFSGTFRSGGGDKTGGVKSNFWAVNDQRDIVVVIVDRFQNFAGHRHGV